MTIAPSATAKPSARGKIAAMNSSRYVHLRLHSEYSITDGIVRIADAAKAASAPAVALPTTYEAALQELEQLVARIESGQMPLDDVLAGYQRGAALLAFCRTRLQAVQEQIKVLDDGVLQPWTHD